MAQGWESPFILIIVLSQSCPLGQALVNLKAFENIKIHLSGLLRGRHWSSWPGPGLLKG